MAKTAKKQVKTAAKSERPDGSRKVGLVLVAIMGACLIVAAALAASAPQKPGPAKNATAFGPASTEEEGCPSLEGYIAENGDAVIEDLGEIVSMGPIVVDGKMFCGEQQVLYKWPANTCGRVTLYYKRGVNWTETLKCFPENDTEVCRAYCKGAVYGMVEKSTELG